MSRLPVPSSPAPFSASLFAAHGGLCPFSSTALLCPGPSLSLRGPRGLSGCRSEGVGAGPPQRPHRTPLWARDCVEAVGRGATATPPAGLFVGGPHALAGQSAGQFEREEGPCGRPTPPPAGPCQAQLFPRLVAFLLGASGPRGRGQGAWRRWGAIEGMILAFPRCGDFQKSNSLSASLPLGCGSLEPASAWGAVRRSLSQDARLEALRPGAPQAAGGARVLGRGPGGQNRPY